MKRTKEKITIKEVRVLGSYGKMFHDTEVYPHSLRKLSKDVKKSDTTAIAIAARRKNSKDVVSSTTIFL